MGKIKAKVKPAKKLTRKELRKQRQHEKKENKRIFFSNKTKGKELVAAAKAERIAKKSSGKAKKKKVPIAVPPEQMSIEQLLSGEVASDNDESIASDFSDEEVDVRLPAQLKEPKQNPSQPAPKKVKQQVAQRPDAVEQHSRELKRQKDLESAARKQRLKQLKLDNEEEDKVIARLEKKLKMNKSKDKNRLVRKMFNDGLDYALELCLDDEDEKRKRELKLKQKENQQLKRQSDDLSDDNEGDDFGLGMDDGESEQSGSEMVEDFAGDGDRDEGDESDVEDAGSIENNTKETKEMIYTEDIYGRTRDKDGNIVREEFTANEAEKQKYLPPHLRARLAAQSDDKQAQIMERLRKHCKGLLNRLSEANLHKISTGIEELYMKNSRFNMNETLTVLLTDALISRTMANERMVQEHMVLLAYLHAHIGNEVGAHFLQMFVEQYNKFLQEIQVLAVEDKRLNNVVLVLGYMYLFRIYDHRLLLEIISKLSEKLCEKSIECLLLIFKSVGFKLRKDDPLAFKEMMLGVQRKISESPLEVKENMRLKFMVDVLNAVKNNNINKIPQFDPELAESLRKRLKAMLRNDKYVITLNISIDDLLRADQVGKWWIVGSAWSGNVNDLHAASKKKKNSDPTGEQRYSEKLLALAKKQKMNTEERRNIFCIIMSAEDYIDAFEKILHLALKDQRIIAYVVLHCCLNEKVSNPYYAHLALKFCNYNRKFQLAFQFATWDRINEIDSLSRLQIKNFAKFLQHLILNGGLGMSVLKVVDFVQLDKHSFLLMKEVMVALLLHTEETVVYQAFERVAKNTKLQQFKNNMRLFLQHFLLQEGAVSVHLDESAMNLLKKRVAFVDNVLAYVDL